MPLLENHASRLMPVFLGINQINEGKEYEGSIQIGNFRVFYSFESIIPISEIKDESLRKLSEIETRKIFFPTKILTTSTNEKIKQSEKEFIFFHNLLYPNIKKFHFDPEISRFNEMKKKKIKSCLVDRKGSLKEPLRMITIPQKIYIFEILVNKIPPTILIFTQYTSNSSF